MAYFSKTRRLCFLYNIPMVFLLVAAFLLLLLHYLLTNFKNFKLLPALKAKVILVLSAASWLYLGRYSPRNYKLNFWIWESLSIVRSFFWGIEFTSHSYLKKGVEFRSHSHLLEKSDHVQFVNTFHFHSVHIRFVKSKHVKYCNKCTEIYIIMHKYWY